MATIASSDPRPQAGVDAPRAVRAFFALSPDAEVRESLAALGRDVARRCRGRAVSPENAHLTLAFIGDIDKSALPVLQRVGDGVPKSGFDVNFDSLGAWRASGVAWIAPSVLPAPLQRLHAALAKSLAEVGFTLESRPFRPHVTLARRCLSRCRAPAARPSSGTRTNCISSVRNCARTGPSTATSLPGN